MMRLCVTAAEAKHSTRTRTGLGRVRGNERLGKYGEAVKTIVRMERKWKEGRAGENKLNKSYHFQKRCNIMLIFYLKLSSVTPATKFSLLHNPSSRFQLN